VRADAPGVGALEHHPDAAIRGRTGAVEVWRG